MWKADIWLTHLLQCMINLPSRGGASVQLYSLPVGQGIRYVWWVNVAKKAVSLTLCWSCEMRWVFKISVAYNLLVVRPGPWGKKKRKEHAVTDLLLSRIKLECIAKDDWLIGAHFLYFKGNQFNNNLLSNKGIMSPTCHFLWLSLIWIRSSVITHFLM